MSALTRHITTSETSLDETAVAELRKRFRGELLLPTDAGYEAHRRVWNAAIDRYPSLIARCTGTRDVVEVVKFARERDLTVSVRGGGHNIAGLAVWDGAVMIDLSRMKGVQVDAVARLARAQGGVTWGDYDHETQAFGLASPGGLQSTTGIGGFTLGGGFGWLSRTHGLACDNLERVEVVTASGEITSAGPEENEDLFWGLRGGGGNFGIVTSFTYRLHPVGPEVMCGIRFFRADDISKVLRFVRDFVPQAPNQVFVGCTLRTAAPAPFLPPEVHGTRVIGMAMFFAGPADEGEKALEPLRSFAKPIADIVQRRPYTVWQQILDNGWGPGAQNYWKAEYLRVPDDAGIDTITDHFSRVTSPLSDIKFAGLGGAVSSVAPEDSAYTHRKAPFILNINTRWDRGDADEHIAWTRGLWSAMRPQSAGGVYVNFLGQEGPERVLEAYGEEKFKRLSSLKRRYDPTNFFHVNQNIPPI
jgi:FAD/FMN-containing dehydrogenase